MGNEQAYILCIVALHIGFVAVLPFYVGAGRRFRVAFSLCWSIEGLRAAMLLMPGEMVGDWYNEWYGAAELLCLPATWFLLSAIADLRDVRLSRWLGIAYVGSGVLLILFGRYGLPYVLQNFAGMSADDASFTAVGFNLITLFVPVAAIRLIVLWWLLQDFLETGHAGAAIATLFCVPYVLVAVAVPFQYFYSYNPEWSYHVWFVRVFGFSLGVLMLLQSRQVREFRRLESELSRVSRINTVAEMSTDISHELSQPLFSISTYATACRIRLRNAGSDDDELNSNIEQIVSLAEDASEMIRGLRDLTKMGTGTAEFTPVGAHIRETVNMLSYEIQESGTDLKVSVPEPDVILLINRVQIRQVLINLIRNAIESMQDAQADGRVLSVSAALKGKSLEISIDDQGPGIAPHLIDTIFEPFVTSKPSGTGVGLSICSRIMDAHNGDLRAFNKDTGGASFRFTLPVPEENNQSNAQQLKADA